MRDAPRALARSRRRMRTTRMLQSLRSAARRYDVKSACSVPHGSMPQVEVGANPKSGQTEQGTKGLDGAADEMKGPVSRMNAAPPMANTRHANETKRAKRTPMRLQICRITPPSESRPAGFWCMRVEDSDTAHPNQPARPHYPDASPSPGPTCTSPPTGHAR